MPHDGSHDVFRVPPVTTTDALKLIALGLILIDHVGHFLADDWPILRVIGRLGAPIFFFLIGFARTRTIPMRWLVLGVVLTAVDYLWTGRLSETLLNILFNFALIRIALPFVERHAVQDGLRLAALVAVCLAMLWPAGYVLEYGANGWLFALYGLLHRRVLDDGAGWTGRRDVLMFIAFTAYVAMEQRDYGLGVGHTVWLAILMMMLVIALSRFKRHDLPWQPGEKLAGVMRLAGRHSLEIYAAQIILLAAAGGLWNLLASEG